MNSLNWKKIQRFRLWEELCVWAMLTACAGGIIGMILEDRKLFLVFFFLFLFIFSLGMIFNRARASAERRIWK